MNSVSLISLTSSSKLLSPSLLSPSLLLFRNMSSRRSMYGSEEGFDLKNEARKAEWLRKKRPVANSEDFRADHMLPHSAFKSHRLLTRPDWRHKDGRPGRLNASQRLAMEDMQALCEDIHEALKYVSLVNKEENARLQAQISSNEIEGK